MEAAICLPTWVVGDLQPGQFVVVSFDLLDYDGKIIVTASQTEENVNPRAEIIIGTQVTGPCTDRGLSVRVEASSTPTTATAGPRSSRKSILENR